MGKKGRGKGKGKKQRKMAALLAAQAPALEPAFAVGQAADGAGADRLDEPVDRPPGSTELAARLASISTVLQRHIARADAGAGLTRARLSALTLLVLGGPRTLGELAAAERVRPPTMTRLVHAMEADGLVVRERNPADGRSIIIRASRLGEEQLEQGRARQLAPLADAIAGLGPDQRRQLDDAAGLLGRVLRASESESRRTE
jgi:DNA-binding MarR family transcriptional regulator